MITIFLGIIAVAEVLLFVKVVVDLVLALYFRKQDTKAREEFNRTIRMLSYQITEIDSRVKKIEQEKESKQND